MIRHFLDIPDLSSHDLQAILADAKATKQARKALSKGSLDPKPALPGHMLAMIFEKSSTRTRVSFDMAIRQLGGSSMILSSQDMQLGRGESVADTARVLSRYVDAIMIRSNQHATLLEMAQYADVPVINGLTDRSHPCQILADLLTLQEHFGDLSGLQIAWVGDGNNVASSFLHAAPKFGFSLSLGCAEGFLPNEDDVGHAKNAGADITVTTDPQAAVAGADVVIADTFVSMGDQDAEHRLQSLSPYQVDGDLMAKADSAAVFLHCLPAHRGEEVSAKVIDGPQSLVFDEAENRLHVQKSVLKYCFDKL
ncbi:Ornithine carbamoyltransferase [hydrothermal vent metagenome]|uniref:ornithine carbamoyltransferase n=1 Tax=hydrothermal vent metagenome TaxID=652676 RepID=A0A3B0RCN6_9ZZZZ